MNRTWPGRANGTLTEQTAYAFMELIQREKVDVVDRPARGRAAVPGDQHDRHPPAGPGHRHDGVDDADRQRGLQDRHRVLAADAPRPVAPRDRRPLEARSRCSSRRRSRSSTPRAASPSREQLLSGQDEFVVKAGKHGLLFETIDEKGWPIAVRVGRHTSSRPAGDRDVDRGSPRPAAGGTRRAALYGPDRERGRPLPARSQRTRSPDDCSIE